MLNYIRDKKQYFQRQKQALHLLKDCLISLELIAVKPDTFTKKIDQKIKKTSSLVIDKLTVHRQVAGVHTTL